MELDDEDQSEYPQPISMSDKPRFPYGLRISLTEKELSKLGFDATEMVVGGLFHLHGMARITSVSTNERQGGDPGCCVEAQIEDLEIESEDEENDG